MKNQALFSSKDKSKKLKCCLLQFLFGALRVKEKKLYNMYLYTITFCNKLIYCKNSRYWDRSI